jgi:hypothetical protein
MPQAMPTEIQQLSERIEECYEFTLSYAARGLAGEEGGDAQRQLRDHLSRAVEAMRGLEQSCVEAMLREQLVPANTYEAFFAVLKRDAQSSIAAIELVLAQPAVGSQLIDNLNASIHLRALLADLFLVTEILEARRAQTAARNGISGQH